MKFRKHPNYMGKYLNINVNGGDRRIEDHEVLEGPQYHRFVAYGWLLPVEEGDAAAVVPSKAVAAEDIPKAIDPSSLPGATTKEDAPKEDASKEETSDSDGTTTMSPASKTGGSGGGRSRRGS